MEGRCRSGCFGHFHLFHARQRGGLTGVRPNDHCEPDLRKPGLRKQG
jgi:hypothetical protein